MAKKVKVPNHASVVSKSGPTPSGGGTSRTGAKRKGMGRKRGY